jgi:hypothetical protein
MGGQFVLIGTRGLEFWKSFVFARGGPAGPHGSTHVQLMSARAPVQITTATEYEPGVPGGNGVAETSPGIFTHCSRSGRARCAHAASLVWNHPPWRARIHAPVPRACVNAKRSWSGGRARRSVRHLLVGERRVRHGHELIMSIAGPCSR